MTQEDGERDTGERGRLVASKRSEGQGCDAGRWNLRLRVEAKAHRECGGSCRLSRADWLWDGGHSHPC